MTTDSTTTAGDKPKLKAYVVDTDQADGYLFWCKTTNRSRAQYLASHSMDGDSAFEIWSKYPVRRVPAMDDLELTAKNFLETGSCAWVECSGCSAHIYAAGWEAETPVSTEQVYGNGWGPVFYDRNESAYCSVLCALADVERLLEYAQDNEDMANKEEAEIQPTPYYLGRWKHTRETVASQRAIASDLYDDLAKGWLDVS